MNLSRLNFSFAALALTAFCSSLAFAFPLPKQALTREQRRTLSQMAGSYNFAGIVALDDCSGSLVRLPQAKDSDYALVLTNGHCYEGGFFQSGQVLVNQPSSRTFQLFDQKLNTVGELQAQRVLFGTMTRTDITLYETNQTYAQIAKDFGIQALPVSADHPTKGQALDVLSGYWQKGYSCHIDNFVHELHEGDWTFTDSVRYSKPGCEIIPGTSGSPVLSKGTRAVIAINNTLNENGERCTVDNPCEVDAQGHVTVSKGTGYGQETYWLTTCSDSTGHLDLHQPGCLLPQPR